MHQQSQSKSSTSENSTSSLSYIPSSLRFSSGIEISFTVHSYPRCIHLNGDKESVSSLIAIIPTDRLYNKLEENSRPPAPDLYHYPMRLDHQILNHPRQDLRLRILPVNRISKSLRDSANTPNRELTGLTQISTELK